MSFSSPAAPSAGVDLKDHMGALLLFDVFKVEPEVKTIHGLQDAISCDLHVLDGPGAGSGYASTLIFPKILVSQLRKSLGEKVLGRLGQGTAKPGQSAPWVLNEASPEDIAIAEKWVAENTKPSVQSAAAPF